MNIMISKLAYALPQLLGVIALHEATADTGTQNNREKQWTHTWKKRL